MTETFRLIITSCFIGSLLVFTGCTGPRKDSGHYQFQQLQDRETADKLKLSIRQVNDNLFQPFQYTDSNNITIRYRLLNPAKTNSKNRYPLVLVLHGSGAVGADNTSQLGILAKLWAQSFIREKYPAYIVAPQFPQRSSNYVLDENKKVLVSSPAACLSTALQLIDSLKQSLPVDQRKIYVIGFSMGASSAVNALELKPGLFAAAISISGIPSFRQVDLLAQTPLWLIHGNADTENPIGSDSLLYQTLQPLGKRHTLFWEINKFDHDIYAGLFTGDQIPRWLFRHKTPKN